VSAAPDDPDAGAAPAPTPAARRRADGTGRGTATLPELRRLVEDQFLTGFSHRIWVTGQVDGPEQGHDGGLHFELVALDDDSDRLRLPCDIPADVLPELRALLHRVADADLDDVVAPGRAARVGGLLRYDFAVHRLALAVSAVDPATTAQALAELRASARNAVLASGLQRHQRRLAPPVAPVHVALVGGECDPAVHRAADRLRASGYGVDLRVAPAVLAGTGASARLAEALARVAGHCEVVLLVRGEGRELELAAFDGEELARAVAATPVPVVAGLGGRGERTVCDEVAAESLPTADAAVGWVLRRLAEAEEQLQRWRREVRVEAEAALDRARVELEQAAAAVEAVAEEAAGRAEEAARRRRQTVLVAAGVAAVVVVALAVALGNTLVLLALLVVAGGVAAATWGATAVDRRGSTMALDETSFAQVLERLERIRDELARTSMPETVQTLHEEARRLVARGEQVLGRGTQPAPVRTEVVSPAPPGAGSGDGDTTSVVLRPTGGAAPATDSPSSGDDVPTQRATTVPRWTGGDSDTTQVIPTTGR
jgi:exodeoxyribonuclease VII large subunit